MHLLNAARGSVVILLAFLPASFAAPPSDAKARADLVGTPTELLVHPPAIALTGPRDRAQLVVTGKYADGSARDLTAACEFVCQSGELVSIEPSGYVAARQNGSSTLLVKAGAKSTQVPLVVK